MFNWFCSHSVTTATARDHLNKPSPLATNIRLSAETFDWLTFTSEAVWYFSACKPACFYLVKCSHGPSVVQQVWGFPAFGQLAWGCAYVHAPAHVCKWMLLGDWRCQRIDNPWVLRGLISGPSASTGSSVTWWTIWWNHDCWIIREFCVEFCEELPDYFP